MLPAKTATEARRIRNSTFIDRQGYQSPRVLSPSRKCIVRLRLDQRDTHTRTGQMVRSILAQRLHLLVGVVVVQFDAAGSNRRTTCDQGSSGHRFSQHGVGLGPGGSRCRHLRKNNDRPAPAVSLKIGHNMAAIGKAGQTRSSWLSCRCRTGRFLPTRQNRRWIRRTSPAFLLGVLSLKSL
jgi:hypothetical protein